MTTQAATEAPAPGPAVVDDLPAGHDDLVARLTRRVLPIAFLGGVLLLMVRLATAPLGNTDTFFHLRFGHKFVTGTWSLREPGSVSSFDTAEWLPTQWLPQVAMAWTEDRFGLGGVAWLAGLLFVVVTMAYYLTARSFTDPGVAVAVTVLALCASAAGMSMRPQVISYAFVAVTVALWLRAVRRGRAPWLLIPLTWVWAMCHGMWPTGIVVGLVVVAGHALDSGSWRPLRWAAVPLLSLVAACLTPVGPGLVRAVLTVSSRSEYFTEWGAPVFTHLNTVSVLVMIGISAVVAIRRGGTWVEIACLALAGAWAVYSLRTVPVAAAMLVPLLASQWRAGDATRVGPGRAERRATLAVVVAALVVLTWQVPRAAGEPAPELTTLDPVLADLPDGSTVLSDVGFGGYLMWRFPGLDLISHGYGDTYTDGELERNASFSRLSAGWRENLAATGVEYAVLDPGSELAYALRDLAGWRVVARSGSLELLEPPVG